MTNRARPPAEVRHAYQRTRGNNPGANQSRMVYCSCGWSAEVLSGHQGKKSFNRHYQESAFKPRLLKHLRGGGYTPGRELPEVPNPTLGPGSADVAESAQ